MNDPQLEALTEFLYWAPIGLLQTRLSGDIVLINPHAARYLLPINSDGILENLFDALAQVLPELRSTVLAFTATAGPIFEAKRVSFLIGTELQFFSLSIRKTDADLLMVSVADISAEVRLEETRSKRQLLRAASKDPLTGLASISVVFRRINKLLTLAEVNNEFPKLALFSVNIDRFKQINDSYGRGVGDEVLRQIAKRIEATLRTGDSVAQICGAGMGRVAGDEFAVLIENLSSESNGTQIAKRLAEQLSKPYSVGMLTLTISVRIGIALCSSNKQEATTLLQQANLAARSVSLADLQRYSLFKSQMLEDAARRGRLETELRTAIENNQIFVVYQPIVDLVTMNICSVEALARWSHPQRGIVSPLEFIPLAEESGLIHLLGEFVLHAACKEFMFWQSTLGELAPTMLSVNLSRAQLSDCDFSNRVRVILKNTGMKAESLQLEITESLAAQDSLIQARLLDLKKLGLTLALDDFGCGYSSLSSLNELPVDVIKIDRSFVEQAASSEQKRVLIQAVIMVAKSLGMQTVAEGIETKEQMTILQEMLCERGQGFLFAKPISSEAISDLISQPLLLA
jgi:diguanylate cyclase (GGDEF)-like protein